MSKLISFGKWNFYYILILLYINSIILLDYLSEHNYNETFSKIKILPSREQTEFSRQYFIHYIFKYLGILPISIIIYFKYDADKEEEFSTSGKNTIILIHNDSSYSMRANISLSFYILIIFLWVLEEQLIIIFNVCLKDIDFWMIELFIVSYQSSKLFHFKIYKHHKLAIIFNAIVPVILKILTIVYSFIYKDDDLKILYKDKPIFIVIGLGIYLILITLRSFVNTRMKWHMDLKYIPISQILALYGFIGTIFCIFITTIMSIFFKNENKNKFDGYSYYYFLSGFSDYFKYFEEISISEIFKEIIIVIISFIFFFFNKYLFLHVIKYFTPVHVIFCNSFYFIFDKVFLIINTQINEKKTFKNDSAIRKIKFFLDLSSDLVSILGFLLYLEIIILKFFDYDYNTKPNIIKRSFIDAFENMERTETFNSEQD